MTTDQDLTALINLVDIPGTDQEIFPIRTLDFKHAELQGVLPLLHFKIAHLDLEPGQIMEQSVFDQIARYSHHCAASEMQLAAGYEQAFTILKHHEPVVLKGAVMAYEYYQQPFHRPMTDVDLLIPGEVTEAVKNEMVQNGFDLASSNAGEIVLTQFSCTKNLANGLTLHLDIHSQLFNRPGMHDLLGYSDIRAGARQIHIFGQAVLAPCSSHCLLHACLHLMAHHENSRRLIWLYDIKLILEKFTDDDAAQLLEFTQSSRIARVVLTAIDACNRVFPLDNQVLRSELERQAHDQDGSPHKATDLLLKSSPAAVLLSDWKQIKSTGNRLKWLKEHLFPKPGYMRQKYGVKSFLVLLIFYVWRIVKGSVRLFTGKN